MPEWLEVIVRTIFAVVVLFFLTKLLGKRQVSQLSFFEYITGITIGSVAAYISLDTDKTWHLGIIALLVWVLFSLGIEYLQLKSKKARDFIDFKSSVLIKDGKIMEDTMRKERLTTDELLEELRKKDVFKMADVEFAIMESDGAINVLLKKENLPLTPKDLGIKVAPEKETQAVIMDGKILDEPLDTLNLSRSWLNGELEKQGLTVENVFLGQVDSYGELTVDLYADKVQVPQPQDKPQLYALLKKCEADLELFSLSTSNEEAKQMYGDSSARLQKLLQELKPYIQTN
ncbi:MULTISPECIES: DUF421 domain-containing protein [unclassified Paenibacillus]|uniref:DUF421 domain-containing protein n=1 Tax=unclassified Paenibacillus TaxID=185978 RepID=UPI0024063ABB|nr:MULTISPECIES: DUF421 domain-containing protein [unclassified Paenibacillus]MDF9839152.1 uncharacterized membrane protein YcaP (DUF421 family) [Paenibacillus sp. PastF-2]MDF9845734.1 uncharacterized membrane protein YcaP (DUF421 family) [Paenibacillus sp. PastM-2]MDF9852306.1 uncharacterized membrane protein YcaP (DUF421 family) [Paenibacillus sp. PastF-1]MDH6477965.1 uncharacterized membrane protein YcaP (DUF421 family) [Paenibacillus sp. PastH-2]MDH6505700.1 uncharacterized membrane protei